MNTDIREIIKFCVKCQETQTDVHLNLITNLHVAKIGLRPFYNRSKQANKVFRNTKNWHMKFLPTPNPRIRDIW